MRLMVDEARQAGLAWFCGPGVVRVAGCDGEWFGVPVPRLFWCGGALHPICRQCTSSVRVQRPLSGVAPLIGCSAPVHLAVVAAGDVGAL